MSEADAPSNRSGLSRRVRRPRRPVCSIAYETGGVAAIEYALLASLIAGALGAALLSTGSGVRGTFGKVEAAGSQMHFNTALWVGRVGAGATSGGEARRAGRKLRHKERDEPHGLNDTRDPFHPAFKGGMTPRDALITATRGGAELLELENETGTLHPGKSADLIAVDGDPLSDPTAVTRIRFVMVQGKPIPVQWRSRPATNRQPISHCLHPF